MLAAMTIAASTTGLLLQPTLAPMVPAGRTPIMSPRMGLVDDFAVSRVVKDIRVFDDDYALEIVQTVEEVAKTSIQDKGTFSLAIPGGSVVAALANFAGTDAFDFSKFHIFFCNEKIPSYPCLAGALDVTRKIGVPDENVHGFAKDGSPAEIAEGYAKLLKSHPSIDNSGPLPSVDMMLLGTGPDGHCGCIFPDSAEVKQTGSGVAVLAGNDERADGDFVAVSLDTMNAAKVVLVSAAGAGRAPMVAKALSGEYGAYDCPAGMVEAAEDTLWFTDQEGIAEFDAQELGDDE